MKEKIKRSKSQREAESIPAAMFWDQSPRTACDPGTKLLTAGGHRGTSPLPIRSSPRKEPPPPPPCCFPKDFHFNLFTQPCLSPGAGCNEALQLANKWGAIERLRDLQYRTLLFPAPHTLMHPPTHTLIDIQTHTHTHVVIQTGVLLGSFTSFFRSLVFSAT